MRSHQPDTTAHAHRQDLSHGHYGKKHVNQGRKELTTRSYPDLPAPSLQQFKVFWCQVLIQTKLAFLLTTHQIFQIFPSPFLNSFVTFNPCNILWQQVPLLCSVWVKSSIGCRSAAWLAEYLTGIFALPWQGTITKYSPAIQTAKSHSAFTQFSLQPSPYQLCSRLTSN